MKPDKALRGHPLTTTLFRGSAPAMAVSYLAKSVSFHGAPSCEWGRWNPSLFVRTAITVHTAGADHREPARRWR